MRCSDCKRYRTKMCFVNPSGKDLESAEYLACFEAKGEERKESPGADMGRTEATRSVGQKGTGEKILLVIAGIAVGIAVQVAGSIFLKFTGLDHLLLLQLFNTLTGFAVMGFCIYYWVFRAKKGKQKEGNASKGAHASILPTIAEPITTYPPTPEATLDSSSTTLDGVPQGTKRGRKETWKTNRLVWEIPLLAVLIVIAVLIWQKPDWFRVSGGISTPSAPIQQGVDTGMVLLTQYFNKANPIIEGHIVMLDETIDAVNEAIEEQARFSGIHITTTEEIVRWLEGSGANKAAINKLESSIHKIDSEIVNFEILAPPTRHAMVHHNLIIDSFRIDQDALYAILYCMEHGACDDEFVNQCLQQARLKRSDALTMKRFCLY